MRLQKSQKEALLSWIAEGQQSDEINQRAAVFEPPFKVSRQQVDGYRTRRQVEIAALKRAGEYDALREGLAVRAERVRKLQQLAALMEQDLFGGFLWVEDTKAAGSGPFTKFIDIEKFNQAEVSEYRATLDDIAKEMGERKQSTTLLNVTPEQLLKMPVEELEALAKKRGLL